MSARWGRPRTWAHDESNLRSALVRLADLCTAQSAVLIVPRLARDLPALDAEAEFIAYMVAQDRLTHISRHRRATRVEIVSRHTTGRSSYASATTGEAGAGPGRTPASRYLA